MNQFNRTAQLILLVLILVYVAGFFIAPSWQSYLAGSVVMYLMTSIVLNKMKIELKQLQANGPVGEKAKGQWKKPR